MGATNLGLPCYFCSGYKLGKGFHTCEVIVENNGSVTVSSGIEELSILKTTQV